MPFVLFFGVGLRRVLLHRRYVHSHGGGLLGLQTLPRFTIPQGSIAFVADKKGDTMLELIQSAQAEPVRASGMTLGFVADRPLAELRVEFSEA